MEWVEGRTLRQALDDGPLPVDQAWSVARQVAAGLAAAHAKGIVHRDLKPENVMLGLDGRARILDFGLARISVIDVLDDSRSTAQTMAAPSRATAAGSILGTVGYMSPEQASGRPVDNRSDQFALGVLTYEMLAGRQAFERPSVIETLSAILHDDPAPLGSLRSGVTRGFERVVMRCMAKAPANRFESTRDLVEALAACDIRTSGGDLETLVPDVAARSGASGRGLSRWRSGWLIAGALTVTLGVAGAVWQGLGSAMPAAIGSVAVLPFESVGAAPEDEYLGDGLAGAVIAQMSQVPSLRVIARGTAFHFRGAKDPRAVGRQLGVASVVTGRVTRKADRLSVSAELIDVASGVQLWSEKYDAPLAEVLRVQDALVSNLSSGLRLRLSDELKRTLVVHGTEDAEAYTLLLKGRSLLVNDTEEDDLAARGVFRQALERDPGFIEARLDLVATYIRSAGNLYAAPTDAWGRAEEELKIVLSRDPQNSRARLNHAVRYFMYDWDWAKAEEEFARLRDDPRVFLSNAYHPVAIFAWVRGRMDEAVAIMERALVSDPQNVESQVMRADFLAQAGRLDDAVAAYTAIASANPDDARPLFGTADIMKRRGDIAEAIRLLRKAYEVSDEPAGAEALADARTEADYEAAERVVARSRLEDLTSLAQVRYVSPLDLARLHAQLGQSEQAFASLALAVAERSPGLVHLKVDRAWDAIRADRRFAAVVRQVGIP
jgi:TolB-like protein/tetratricopeptide (TPR) repeat protein